ncbi:unnamed protein product [Parajaminaea phylloscopi]
MTATRSSSHTASATCDTPSGFPSHFAPLFARPPSSIPLLPSQPFDPLLKSAIRKEAQTSRWTPALEASVHLLNDDLTAAHDIVTDREDEMDCNLSHAVLHRREGEWWNSLYWARQLSHPFVEATYGSRAGCADFFQLVKDTASVSKKRRSHSQEKDKDLDSVQSTQEKELKGLVKWLWEHQ